MGKGRERRQEKNNDGARTKCRKSWGSRDAPLPFIEHLCPRALSGRCGCTGVQFLLLLALQLSSKTYPGPPCLSAPACQTCSRCEVPAGNGSGTMPNILLPTVLTVSHPLLRNACLLSYRLPKLKNVSIEKENVMNAMHTVETYGDSQTYLPSQGVQLE